MTYTFGDTENDSVTIRFNSNSEFSTFVEYKDSKTATIKVQSNIGDSSQIEFAFLYTDSYHKDTQDWNHFRTFLYLFSSEPPYFNDILKSVNGNKWNDFQFVLPQAIDPNNDSINVKLGNSTPEWVKLKDNSTLIVLSKTDTDTTEGITQVEIILQNSFNSWINYTLNITIDPYKSPIYSFIPDIQTNQLANGVFIKVESFESVNIVECNSVNQIPWLVFVNSTLLFSPNSSMPDNLVQSWVRLSSKDSWNNYVYSNSFYIKMSNKGRPPVLLNSLGPLSLPKGKYSLFNIPDDLFIDFDGNELTYNVSLISWSQDNFFDVGVIKDKFSIDSYLLYAYSNYSIYWKTSLIAFNKYNQSAETEVEFKVFSWSSISWIKCDGPYQIQCTKWAQTYELDNSGACLNKIEFFLFSEFNFFRVLGITTWIFIIIHIILSIFLGKLLLNCIWNVQIFIILIWSFSDLDQSASDYIFNILFIKFNFGFLHSFIFDINHIKWKIESK